MSANARVLGAIAVIVAGLAVAAYYIGPPLAPPAPPSAAATLAAPADTTLISANLAVDSFGATPACGDEIAIRTVTGMLRSNTFVRILGLANIADLGEDQPRTRECEARIEIGRGKVAPVRYRISQSEGHVGWQITVHPDAALTQVPPPRL